MTTNLIKAWLTRTFPLRHLLCAEIGADVCSRIPIPVDVDDKSFLGDLMELAIGLSLCDQPPYLHLFDVLGEERAARLLPLAGYHRTSVLATGLDSWQRSGRRAEPAKFFLAAYRLAQVMEFMNPRSGARPKPDAVARYLRQHPDALPHHGSETVFEWRAFADLWASYNSGFHTALNSYGKVTAHVTLLGGLRCADFLVGTTVLEVKSGRLDIADYRTQLIDQMISYSLLAHHDERPVTHAAVYAIRYQRLLRFPIERLLNRLAGHPIDLDKTSADLAALLQDSRGERAA
ncbi:hypothetical protein [Actinoplanes aureus]|uniref:Rhodanese domain-containing protein n=1 Tax=Actinoplanes aureus TaxID=2792083 RepID=A0A931C533_9ACTN|nr:hypothetical protein [Actinoplanes aureus]MBG0560767.1 hypothetical protein [Actinoplanes aureus]